MCYIVIYDEKILRAVGEKRKPKTIKTKKFDNYERVL
jgi:hypothetical protein